jgi:hypothetical protein
MKILFLIILVFVILPLAVGNQVEYKKREFKNHNKNNEKSKQNSNTP